MRFLAKIALKLFLLLQNATYWYSLRIQVFRCLYGKQLPIQNYINRILLLRQSKLFYLLLLSLCFVFTVPCGLQQYIKNKGLRVITQQVFCYGKYFTSHVFFVFIPYYSYTNLYMLFKTAHPSSSTLAFLNRSLNLIDFSLSIFQLKFVS